MLFTLLSAVFGILVGNFLTVVVYRLPLMMELEFEFDYRALLEAAGEELSDEKLSLFRPSARCFSCRAPLGLLDSLPLVSYFLRSGKCHACKEPIPLDIPLLEVVTPILFGVCAAEFGPSLFAAAGMLYISLLLALAVIDAKTMLLPDALTIPGLWLGLLGSVFIGFTTPATAIIGAAAGYLFPAVTAGLYAKLRGRRGMGHGDFKLFGMIGAWLGWTMLPAVFSVGFGLAIIGFFIRTIWRHASNGEGEIELSFGPYLAIAGIAILLRPMWFAPLLM